MNSLFILIPIAFLLVFIGLAVFFWAVKSGQYDDLDNEAKRILFDDHPKAKQTKDSANNKRE